LRWRFYEGVFAYTLARWDDADAAMGEVMRETTEVWPHLYLHAALYRERIAGWRERPLTEPRNPLLVNGEALKD
ncbi:MAG TPA: hypothetical protein PK961_13140, partial [bacterium]|nr:hypothetical protein [bacterium]